MDYRDNARKHLKRCEEELSSGQDERVKYAALELRMAMESLTYDRALAYKDEFPPQEYGTWQPKKVMAVLLEIDSTVDKDYELTVGKEEKTGVTPPVMHSMGSEKVLNMGMLRKHYDALGSYLHVQIMKQACSGKPLDYNKIRSRCDEIAAFVSHVLSSPIWNCTLGNFATLQCVECRKTIRKRIPHDKTEVEAECYECRASYTIVKVGDGRYESRPQQHEVECAKDGCERKIVVWRHELEKGRCWTCPTCKGVNTFVLGISHDTKSPSTEKSGSTSSTQLLL
jgi:hypothetical protein